MLLHWFEDLQVFFLGTKYCQQVFSSFQPKLLAQSVLFGQRTEQFLENSSAIIFCILLSRDINRDYLIFLLAQNFFLFALAHKFHKLTCYWDESLASTWRGAHQNDVMWCSETSNVPGAEAIVLTTPILGNYYFVWLWLKMLTLKLFQSYG